MPSGVVFLVELFLDEGSNVLLYVELFNSLSGTIHSILLHLLRHVSILHNCFPVSHPDEYLGPGDNNSLDTSEKTANSKL